MDICHGYQQNNCRAWLNHVQTNQKFHKKYKIKTIKEIKTQHRESLLSQIENLEGAACDKLYERSMMIPQIRNL